MANRYEVEATVTSAKDLKNVNWRYGRLKPYAVVWVDSKNKCSTRVDEEGDTRPYWDQKLVIPFNSPIEDSILCIDIVHANAAEDVDPLIGSARLLLHDLVGLVEISTRRLDLKGPSGTARGKVKVKVAVREPDYHPARVPPASKYYPAPQTGSPAPPAYGGAPAYGQPQAYSHEMGFKKVQKIDYGKADILVTTNKDSDLYYIGGQTSLISGLPTNNSGIHHGGAADSKPQNGQESYSHGQKRIQKVYYGKADIVISTNKRAKLWNVDGETTIISGIPISN